MTLSECYDLVEKLPVRVTTRSRPQAEAVVAALLEGIRAALTSGSADAQEMARHVLLSPRVTLALKE